MAPPVSGSKKCMRSVSTTTSIWSPILTRERGAKEATNLVPSISWVGTSSVWASLSSSLVSAVTTLGASTSKWTTIWAPRASTSDTVALRRGGGGGGRGGGGG